MGVGLSNQPHLFGEIKIKKGDFATFTVARLVLDPSGRNILFKRMLPIQVAKVGVRSFSDFIRMAFFDLVH